MAIQAERTIIYHVPKTGGTWVKAAMKAAGIRCYGVQDITNSHPFNLLRKHATPDVAPSDKFSICFVRRPIPWYISYWSFRCSGPRRDMKFPADRLLSEDFDEFVNNVLDAYPSGFVTALYQYYTGEDYRKVDFIGRQENLAHDLTVGLTLAGEDFDEVALRNTPPINQSQAEWRRRCTLSDSTRRRVLRLEAWVLESFYE